MKHLALSLILLTIGVVVKGQNNDWEQYLTQLYENEEEAVMSMEEAYERLTELAGQPLDVNAVEANDLMQIPGLNLNQINDILEYRHRYGSLRSIEELAMIESIDNHLRLYLFNFLTVRQPATKPFEHIRHDIALTMQVPTYYRAGDRQAPPFTYLGKNKYAAKYLGDPVKHSLRYSLHVGSNITFNLTGAKSAGEPFGGEYNKWGYDRYAFNLSVKQWGVFRQIILGHYRGQFGMGLILNNNFSIGKQGMLSAIGRRLTTFSPHSSTSDGKHFQGIATTMSLTRRLALSAFWSYRNVDATLNADGSVSTILSSAYHRTEKDMEKKNNTRQMTTGIHLGYERQPWGIGFSAVYSWLNRSLNPTYSKSNTVSSGKLYRLHYPRGNSFWNMSIDYRYRWRELAFNGETAADKDFHLSTVNSLSWRSPWNVTFMAVQRYYTYQYNALYGSSFGDNGNVKNESGLYVGAEWNVSHSLKVDAYTDIAYFPWYKYLVSASSYSWDNSVTGTLTRGKWNFALRYRIRTKQRDKTIDGKKALLTKTDQHLRLIATMTNERWNTRTQIEGCSLSYDERTKGIILSQSAEYKLLKPLSIYGAAAYFNTDDYDSRLYTYERGMKYSFGSASYYGKGMHAALMVKYKMLKWLTAQGKVAFTKYYDRNTIGTAERMIFSSHYTDIDLQLLIKL